MTPPLDDTTSAISAWLVRISQGEALPDGVIAFNIGIFESPTGFTIYLTGSVEFDPEDDDWACREDYTPKERYLELPKQFVDGRDWQKVEADLIDIFEQILASEVDSILSNAKFLTIGFDDGTLTRIR